MSSTTERPRIRPLPKLGQGYQRELPPKRRLTKAQAALLAWWVRPPSILLLGAQPFVRCRVQYHTAFVELGCRREEIVDRHARIRPVFVKYIEGDASPCPACGGHVTDRPDQFGIEKPSTVVCLRCSRMDACHDPAFANQIRAEKVARAAHDECQEAERKLQHAADAINTDQVVLSETERRRIWAGNRRTQLVELVPNITSLAAAGREFLRRINQQPDFDLIIDKRGNTIDRWSRLERMAAEIMARDNPLNCPPTTPEPDADETDPTNEAAH